jgi:hypothetical protein
MSLLADDPTAAAVLAAIPCHPVPPRGDRPPSMRFAPRVPDTASRSGTMA